MELILIDDVFPLGKRGEVVHVADGYGRNYLLPKKLAIPATTGNRKMIEQQRLAMAKKEAGFKEEAELLAQELNQLHLVVSRKTGDTGTLFGSVTSKDIAKLLVSQGIHLDRRKLLMDQPLKTIGNHRIEIRPHSEVSAELLVSVITEADQAVARVKKKDEESDTIIADLENKIKDIQQLAGSRSAPTAPVTQAEPASEEAASAADEESAGADTKELEAQGEADSNEVDRSTVEDQEDSVKSPAE